MSGQCSLSPRLFCLCLAPLSSALRSLEGSWCESLEGSWCESLGKPVTHQLFIEDLKVYTKSKRSMGDVMEVVDRVSTAIGMRLGLRKCAVAHMVGRCITSADYVLSQDRTIASLSYENVYKYLGVKQVFRPALTTIKKRVTQTYHRRLRRIWGSELNARHKVNATNVWAVSVFRYFFFLKWSRRDLDALDRKIR